MRNPSAITESLSVDAPLVQDADYEFDADDRQYIDNQIRGVEQHLFDSLIRGVHATWLRLDASSAAGAAGEVVCLTGSTTVAEPTVTRATPSALADAGGAFGVLLRAAAPGGMCLVAVGGALMPALANVGVSAAFGADKFVIVNASARLARTDTLTGAEYIVGTCDLAGAVTIALQSYQGGGGGGPDLSATKASSPVTGNQDALSVADMSWIVFTGGANVNVRGLSGGVDGQILILKNLMTGGALVTLEHEEAAASDEDRYWDSTATDYAFGRGASAILQYDATDPGGGGSAGRWTRIAAM